ncbi:hypothetical protein EWB00_000609 [Schistosoma japonicum]|uniref:Uncharacterized protein n=1 Tax=Schistosoma japonicum TaxID=6182 RepID=A0A4Z2CKW8_SCHJA|nr:hypothetical protein EWB00_000609 [Schistosoma japonicum]
MSLKLMVTGSFLAKCSSTPWVGCYPLAPRMTARLIPVMTTSYLRLSHIPAAATAQSHSSAGLRCPPDLCEIMDCVIDGDWRITVLNKTLEEGQRGVASFLWLGWNAHSQEECASCQSNQFKALEQINDGKKSKLSGATSPCLTSESPGKELSNS